MSLPQFKEICSIEIGKLIQEHAAYLIEQRTATLDQMRDRQGIIAGLNIALEVIGDQYRKMYG